MTLHAFVLGLLLAGPAPLTMSGDGFAVSPVQVNGRGPFLLVVDTAAGSSAIYPRLTRTLGLDRSKATPVAVQGASGVQQVPLFRIGPVETGGAKVKRLSAVELDAGHLLELDEGRLQGILGADFLSKFDVEMDFTAGEMRLSEPARNAPQAAVEVSLLFGRFLIIPARVEGAGVAAVVDTGARRSLMNWQAARAIGLEPGDERLRRDEPVQGATTDETEAFRFVAKTVSAGGADWEQAEIGVSDLPVFGALGLADGPAMIFGVNLLQGRSLRLDYDEERLLIGPAVEPR